MIQIIVIKKIKVNNKMKLNLKLNLLRRDLARVSLTRSSFGNNEIKEPIQKPIEKLTPKKSRIKRALYRAVVKTGAKVGDYADYTFKQILKVSIKYLGPIVLSAILFRYRTNVYKLLIKKDDRETINNKTAGVGKFASRANEKINNINRAAKKINNWSFFPK